MVINENLIDLKAPLDSQKGVEFLSRNMVNNSGFMPFTSQSNWENDMPELKKGETYTFSAYIKHISGKSEQTTISAGDSSKTFDLSNKYKKISISFRYDNFIKGPYIAIYVGRQGETAGNKISVKYPKIEKGDKATPYLPHKSTVKAENQAYYPPEGNYKEIEPMRG